MGLEAVGSAQRRVRRQRGGEEPAREGSCSVNEVTQVLSCLLSPSPDAEEVRNRAVALGLLRLSDGHERTRLTLLTASRLLLVGYRLPAQLEAATIPRLRELFQHGCLVHVLLPGPDGWHRVRGFSHDRLARPNLLLGHIGGAAPAVWAYELEAFAQAWAEAGNLLVVAARGWGELPALGSTFFGGALDPDGVYHWEIAQCDTDAQGCVLRY